jgi:hypothetical protein
MTFASSLIKRALQIAYELFLLLRVPVRLTVLLAYSLFSTNLPSPAVPVKPQQIRQDEEDLAAYRHPDRFEQTKGTSAPGKQRKERDAESEDPIVR